MATLQQALGSPLRKAQFQIYVEVPKRIGIAKRHHNRIAREALHAVITRHHKRTIPRHFEEEARGKYGYKPRTKKYRADKLAKFKSRTDLVKTGATRARMKREGQIVIGGAAEGGKKPIEGRLLLRFDFTQTAAFKRSQVKRFVRRFFGAKESRPRSGVSIADMHREVQAMTADERKAISELFLAEYMKRFDRFEAQRQRHRPAK